jgi:SAM-dependent methyltransferase
MIQDLVQQLRDVLACPYCLGTLQASQDGLNCPDCQTLYPFIGNAQIDLRLQRPKPYPITFEVGKGFGDALNFGYDPLKNNSEAEIDFTNQPVPTHFTQELRSYLPRATHSEALVLDLGCGATPHRPMCERAGFRYVGLDYKNEVAPILGDAHALPFRDESFELIVSMNVLEHLQYPPVAYAEVRRVLQKRGVLIGSVAFLEPFHDNSFYHHTHLGTYNTLSRAGLRVLKVSPNVQWPVLTSLRKMQALPRIIYPLLRLANLLVQLRDKLRPWPARVLRSSGSFFFIATKEV